MPISFDLEKIRSEYNCSNYFETGLWDPREDISAKLALKSGFNSVCTIEIREDWVEMGKNIFRDEILNGRYKLILDDSSNMKEYLNDSIFNEKTIFFLDAHVDNNNIFNYKYKCPLLEELNAIESLQRKDNIIMIDDLRIISQPFPWGESSYGDNNFLKLIINKIHNINTEYKFKLLDGVIKDDVLMAYV
jgi:hypothetical protein